ncbi:MAG: hypothetical protein JWO92_987 [Chitinophagaceae bacterium]|nr:hypothetical protein [Chitinophagaceae bacterium]
MQYITLNSVIYCITNITCFFLPLHMQQIITPYDFVLLPVYLFIFYLIVRKKSKKYEKTGLKRIFITAFVLRMVGAIFYSLLLQYYYGYGDSFGFYRGGNVISDMIQQDITSVKYLFASGKEIVAAAKAMGFGDEVPVSMPNDSNAFIMKLSAVLSFFTFNKYMVISICFGFFSFIGIWKLFYAFYQLNEKKNVKLLAFFVLYFPSLWFWGSGLLKEPVCVGVLGLIVYLVYKNFVEKKFSVLDMLMLIFFLFILTVVKSYISAILLISFSVILIYKAIVKVRIMILRIVVVVLLLFSLTATLIAIDVSQYIKYFVDNSFGQIQQLQKSYQSTGETDDGGSKGTFVISEMDVSMQGILASGPAVIGTCLFRPFIWESKKVIIFFSSLEALLTLLATIYILFKTRVYRFFLYVFSSPLLLFCFIFSILFALVVGYTTFNFGTLIRYKIVLLPFYFFLLIQIYRKNKEHYLV